MPLLSQYQFILASGSPRRKELFERLGLNFLQQKPEVKEFFPKHFSATEAVVFLASIKNNAIKEIDNNQIVVSSDTVVALGNRILEKPKDAEDAFAMLKLLSGTSHWVHTAVSLRSANIKKSFYDSTEVRFRELSDENIAYYIETYKPFDKAGAYGAQDWLGMLAIERLKGCFYNVMGFPVSKFYSEINKTQW